MTIALSQITSKGSQRMYAHRLRWSLSGVALIGALFTSVPSLLAQTPADNTKVNTRDRAAGAVTADQQKDNVTDRKLTQSIRKALMQDKSLSTYAHNVKVVAQGGTVTLKGPVRSEDEKQNVEAKAVTAAGMGHVINELSVAPGKAR
jgi:hyperosmotically inducible protein